MTPPKRRRLPILICGVLATLVMIVLLVYVVSPAGRVHMILGSHTLALLTRIDAVQAYQIDPNWVQQPKGPVIGQNHLAEMGVDFKGFAIVASGRPQGREEGATLAAILRDPQTYQASKQTCDFSPTIAYRLRAGDETLELLLDFGCDRLQLLTRNSHGQATRTVFGEFGRSRPALVAMTGRAFSGNPAALQTMDMAR
jgi:hypothetical protein